MYYYDTSQHVLHEGSRDPTIQKWLEVRRMPVWRCCGLSSVVLMLASNSLWSFALLINAQHQNVPHNLFTRPCPGLLSQAPRHQTQSVLLKTWIELYESITLFTQINCLVKSVCVALCPLAMCVLTSLSVFVDLTLVRCSSQSIHIFIVGCAKERIK